MHGHDLAQAPRESLRVIIGDALSCTLNRERPTLACRCEVFGYEDFNADKVLAAVASVKLQIDLIAEAASYHRPGGDGGTADETPNADTRAFDDLVRYGRVRRHPRSLYFAGSALWTLGARYSSGPLTLQMYDFFIDASQIIRRAKKYAEPVIQDELDRYREALIKHRIGDTTALEHNSHRVFKSGQVHSAAEYIEKKEQWHALNLTREYLEFVTRTKSRQKAELSQSAALAIRAAGIEYYYRGGKSEPAVLRERRRDRRPWQKKLNELY